MANISNSEQTAAMRAHSYVVEKVHLFTNKNADDQFIDLTGASKNIIITEGIFSEGISVDVTITDAMGLLEGFKIMGNEKVIIQISRSDVESREKKEYNLNLRIANIGGYSRRTEFTQRFTLTCVSDYIYHNELMVLTKPFQGSIGKAIKDICLDNLKIDKKDLEINTETGQAFGVYPRLKPLSAIQWLLPNALENKTPFFFYQRVSDNKVVLESYKNMVDKEAFDTYVYKPFFSPETIGVDEKKAYIEERKKITALSSDLNISQLISIADGCYGSKLHTIDIATKQYTKENKDGYHYKRGDTVKLNDFDALSDNMKLNGDPIKSYYKGKNFFVSQNSLAFDSEDKPNYSSAIGPGYLEAHSYLKNLDTITLEATIPGDFSLKLGDKINTEINRAGSDSNEIPVDNYLSGNYIITNIVHRFTNKYQMELTLQKDSFIESIDEIIQIVRKDTAAT
tara:strand:- start:2221 stop:3582 length:1362 start_codon:yes stop_codon:yes gene_type:complete